MSAHDEFAGRTPGEWWLQRDGAHIRVMADDIGTESVAVVHSYGKAGHRQRVRQEADAALIARAPTLLADNARLQARVAVLEATQAWQPIETAPRDGTLVELLQWRGTWERSAFDSGRWQFIEHSDYDGEAVYDWSCLAGSAEEPTHWRPLLAKPPATPATQEPRHV